MTKINQTLIAIALGVASVSAAQAAPSFNAEVGLSQFERGLSRDRADVVRELQEARAQGLLSFGDQAYPQVKVMGQSARSRADVVRETIDSAAMRAQNARTGVNGYLPG